jgi:hypothetical protein
LFQLLLNNPDRKSKRNKRDRAQLGTASTNDPNSIEEMYLQIPPEIQAKIRQKAESLLATSPQALDSNNVVSDAYKRSLPSKLKAHAALLRL